MPGELGDEQESQNVGYHERRYTPSGEWMLSDVESVPTEGEEETNKKQLGRVLNSLKSKLFKNS